MSKKVKYILDKRFFGCTHYMPDRKIVLDDKTSQADLKRIFDSGNRMFITTTQSNEQVEDTSKDSE